MKTLPLTVLGSLIGGAFLTLASPANAAVHIHGRHFTPHSARVIPCAARVDKLSTMTAQI
jgi:hypothetical protein